MADRSKASVNPNKKKKNASTRSARPTEDEIEYSQVHTQQRNPSAASSKDPAVEGSTSATRGDPISSAGSPDDPATLDLLWITTNKPSNFQDPAIQKMISIHVMRDYQQKEQSGQEPSRTPRGKKSAKSKDNTTTARLSPESSSSNALEAGSIGNDVSSASSSTPFRVLPSSFLSQDMLFTLATNLDSIESRQCLGQLVYRHLSDWFGDHAARLCGDRRPMSWQQWVPIILKNETLLFAQAFAAISHINFLNSNVYGSECLALKGQAIRKINEGLNNTDEARNDANIGAILCMALVSPFENLGDKNFYTHMLGLQKVVALRGGLLGLSSNAVLCESLTLCDLLGAVVFRTELALIPHAEKSETVLEDDLLDSPMQSHSQAIVYQKGSELSPDMMQLLDDILKVTCEWDNICFGAALGGFEFSAQCLSVERRLNLLTSANTDPSNPLRNQVDEACRVSGLIYLRALSHGVPFASPANLALLQDLRKSLDNSTIHGWTESPGVLIWVLLVGTAVERTQHESAFFAGHLSATSICMVAKWHDVHQMFKKFLRIEKTVEVNALKSTRE